jgi:hypothetical protein
MDLIMDLPELDSFNAVLMIIDHSCSKAAKFIPCTTNITGEGVATLYLQHLVPWFGIPRKIISNREPPICIPLHTGTLSTPAYTAERIHRIPPSN